MICPNCKLAGNALRYDPPHEKAARELHERCEAGPTWDGRPATCSCKHEIAPVEDIVAPNVRRRDHPKEAGND